MLNLGSPRKAVSKTILTADLLAGVTGTNGETLSVVNLVASSGSLVGNGDATWTWTPTRNDTSDVQFSYDVTDGTASAPQTAMLDLTPVNDAVAGSVTITGTATQGETLNADITGVTYADGIHISAIACQWLHDDFAIAGSEAKKYVLTQADVGIAISARILDSRQAAAVAGPKRRNLAKNLVGNLPIRSGLDLGGGEAVGQMFLGLISTLELQRSKASTL